MLLSPLWLLGASELRYSPKYNPSQLCDGRRLVVNTFLQRVGNLMDDRLIDLKKLGATIRFLRQGKNWALADLAEKSGVSKAYISDLENGVAGKPNIQYVYNIAVALDVTLDDLLKDSTAKEQRTRRRSSADLPPGLAELQEELALSGNALSADDVENLAQVNFRGNRPRDKEGWRFVLQAIRMAGERSGQK
jgi:transcriptional regulator with XRE-family HTH domain